MLCRLISQKLADVLEVFISAVIALMMETEGTSETAVSVYKIT
jgi:hypothetical protein